MSRKTGKQRTKLQVENHRKRIVELYLTGKNQAQISAEIGLHQTMVSKELAVIRLRWELTYLNLFNTKMMKELEQVDREENEYQRQYDQISNSDGGKFVCLKGVRRCVEKRLKILGLDR